MLSDQVPERLDSTKVLPSFIWLLRDVILKLPKDFKTLRDYFIEKVRLPKIYDLLDVILSLYIYIYIHIQLIPKRLSYQIYKYLTRDHTYLSCDLS